MLLDMLRETLDQIEALDPDRDASIFAEILCEKRSDAFDPTDEDDSAQMELAQVIAKKQLEFICEIPKMAGSLSEQIVDPTTHPAVRLMQATALSYLARPEDHIPDGLPAGYGFVDDAILLRAVVASIPEVFGLSPEEIERERLIIAFMGICVPRDVAEEFTDSVSEAITLVQLMAFLPPYMLDDLCRRLIEEPLAEIRPQPPAGVTLPESSGGSWFSLPAGRIGRSDDGAVTYTFEEEEIFLALREGELSIG